MGEKLPSTMRIWQYTSTKGGLENNLKLNSTATVPTPKSNQHLIKVLATALNPVDYKPAEKGLISILMIPKPATPCIDVAGIIVKPAAGSDFKPGQRVFGASATSPFAGAALAEYAAVPANSVIPIPDGVSAVDAAAAPVAALTAWQSILPNIKSGSRVFLNGGSGGTGTYGIQLAKDAGAHVTVSCSTANAELCKSLGADDVLDYKESPVLAQLQARAKSDGPFDQVVDNVFSDPELYWQSHTYAAPTVTYINVAGSPTLSYIWTVAKIHLLPGLLGGGKRKFTGMLTTAQSEQLASVGAMLADGRLKTVKDEVFPFEQAVEAFRKLKTGRAKGKIVVQVAEEVQ